MTGKKRNPKRLRQNKIEYLIHESRKSNFVL
jgi:hypothetical protein